MPTWLGTTHSHPEIQLAEKSDPAQYTGQMLILRCRFR